MYDLLYNVNDSLECDEEGVVCKLLDEGYLFVGQGFNQSKKPCITLHVNCSDVFAWGCADAEPIMLNELLGLYLEYVKDPTFGAVKWICSKRNEKPQKPLQLSMLNHCSWDDIMEGLPENKYDSLLPIKEPR